MSALALVAGALLCIAVGIVISPLLMHRSAFHRGVVTGVERGRREVEKALVRLLRDELSELRDEAAQ